MRVRVLAVATAAVLVGCGAQSDEEAVTSVTEKYARAWANEEFETACDLLTSEAKQDVLAAAVFLGGGDCPAILGKVWDTLDTADQRRLREADIEVTSVKLSGDTAVATLDEQIGDEDGDTHLRKKDGDWLVDADPDDE